MSDPLAKFDMASLRILFVVPDEVEDIMGASGIMIETFEVCMRAKAKTEFMKESSLSNFDVQKTDVIVLQDFFGKNLDELNKKSYHVVGPWCVLVCLNEVKKIPQFDWPIYNVAMYECVVTSSHLSKSTKSSICERIKRMGGFYSDGLLEGTTHLVTNSVKTEKYKFAAERKLKVLLPTWVDAVWEASQTSNVHGNDARFEEFKCCAFHGLLICSTGFATIEERDELNKIVTDNGGQFSNTLKLGLTDVLICDEQNGVNSKKYRTAKKKGTIFCVVSRWVHDSVAAGYCLPLEQYEVENKFTSTPEKSHIVELNFTSVSTIGNLSSYGSTINETALHKNASGIEAGKRKAFDDSYLIEKVDIKKAKECGQFLDGFCIHLVGFKDEDRRKLTRLVNATGATRSDDMTDRVTHVVVGNPDPNELKSATDGNENCAVVTLKWLLDSVEERKPCNEDLYRVDAVKRDDKVDFGSPTLQKKGLRMLFAEKTITESETTASKTMLQEPIVDQMDVDVEENIVEQYLTQDKPEPENNLDNHNLQPVDDGSKDNLPHLSSDCNQDSTTQASKFTLTAAVFYGYQFYLTNFVEQEIDDVINSIQRCMGRITNDISQANFIVAPAFVGSPVPQGKEIVNDLWINESIDENQPVEIKYYHRPLEIKNTEILEGCVICITGFEGCERDYLDSLIENLGGKSQKNFARITSIQKNVLAATHLIALAPNGKKYLAAKQWRLPAVTKDWLLESAKRQKRMPEKDFLVDEQQKEQITEPSAVSVDENMLDFQKEHYKIAFQITNAESTKNTPATQGASDSSTNWGQSTLAELEKSTDSWNVRHQLEQTPNKENVKAGNAPGKRIFNDSLGSDPPTPQLLARARRVLESCNVDPYVGPSNWKTPPNFSRERLPFEVKTPETPYGICFTPNPSKSLRKACLQVINQYHTPHVNQKSANTPIADIIKQFWAQLKSPSDADDAELVEGERCDERKSSKGTLNSQPGTSESPQDSLSYKLRINFDDYTESEKVTSSEVSDDVRTPPRMNDSRMKLVNTRLEELERVMSAETSGKRPAKRQVRNFEPQNVIETKESQPYSVQWDFGKTTQEPPAPNPARIFMISGVSDANTKSQLINKIEALGGAISKSSQYDPEATHLICPKVVRNEKTLCAMAAGKWILHLSYVDASASADTFLNEEEYAYGNVNAVGNIPTQVDKEIETRMRAIDYWRNVIQRTNTRPFQTMRAIIMAETRDSLVRIVEAGGGTVIDVEPPFEGQIIDATHCVLDRKNMENPSLYECLAKEGIYCVNYVYLSDYLHRTVNDIKDHVLPCFQHYF